MASTVTSADLLTDAFGRIQELVRDIASDLDTAALSRQLNPEANSIGWLLWHLLRIQDDHLADAAGTEQVWTAGGWYDRLGLPFDASDTGYGHGPEQVAAVVIKDPGLLIEYSDALHRQTVAYLSGLSDQDLARVVDDRWDPPVTLGVRLVSVLGDDWQHAGQAAFLKGLPG